MHHIIVDGKYCGVWYTFRGNSEPISLSFDFSKFQKLKDGIHKEDDHFNTS